MNGRISLLEAWFLWYADRNKVAAQTLERMWENASIHKFVRSNESVDGLKLVSGA